MLKMVQVTKFDGALLGRASKATKAFLERQGYEILEDDFEGFMVTKDTERNTLAFIRIFISTDDFYEEKDRPKFERAMVMYAAKHDIKDMRMRCDHLSLIYLADSDKLLVRLHIDAINDTDEE